MADALTIQGMIDASADVDTIEKTALEDTIVTARNGREFPSAPRAVRLILEQGTIDAFLFLTKADLDIGNALGSDTPITLVDGDFALALNDDNLSLNGYYQMQSGELVYLKHNPIVQSKTYTDTLEKNVSAKITTVEDSTLLDVAVDKNDNAYRWTDADGAMHLTGINGPVQSNINSLHEQSKNIPALKTDDRLHNFVDTTDAVYAYFDTDANLQMQGDIYKDGVLVSNASATTASRIRHQNLLTLQPKFKSLTAVATKAEYNLINRMPSGISTPTGLVYFYHQQIEGFDGDNTGSELHKAIITIDANLNVTVVSRELFLAPDAPRGIVKHPMLGRTSDNRIILMYEKRLETTDLYVRYQCYSSDEGLTFSEPTLVTPTGTSPAANSILGTTGTILTARNGRLVVPMYTAGGKPFVIYSDNDGVSWAFSQWLPVTYTYEPSITLDLDGNILMDMRGGTLGYRQKYKSYDNGVSWQQFVSEQITPVAANQGVVFTDSSIGAILHTYNAATTRDNYTIAVSYDNGKTFPYRYKPMPDIWYGGYSQVLKWREGVYIVIIEYADDYIGTNVNENSGLIILSLSEVLSNVRYY